MDDHFHGRRGPHWRDRGELRRGRRDGSAHARLFGARCRWWDDTGNHWEVRARVERLIEPALFLLLREGEAHGYELAEALGVMLPDETIDLGNLYRLLRSLEDEGLVRSRWRDDLPGRTKRTYELTADGEGLLDMWVDALRRARSTIDQLVTRHERGVPT